MIIFVSSLLQTTKYGVPPKLYILFMILQAAKGICLKRPSLLIFLSVPLENV